MNQTKKVKMEDIAKDLGVSTVTVFNALKGKKGVGEALRSEIINKAQEMGYEIKNPCLEQGKTQNCSASLCGD